MAPELTAIGRSPGHNLVCRPDARNNEFSTCPEDRPLIAQFGTNSPHYLAKAAGMIREHVDGVNIPCLRPAAYSCILPLQLACT
jgi:hypothetical protein